jgi:electron transport complex protein RnfC
MNSNTIIARSLHQFKGGIHPSQHKTLSTTAPISNLNIHKGDKLCIPLNQHIGLVSLPCVAVGDFVLAGQVIANAQGLFSLPSHASTSGTIILIEERLVAHSSHLLTLCIIICADGKDTYIELEGINNYLEVDRQILIQKISNAGIAGMGGAGFPSSIKLHAPTYSIDTLIINAAECEPYITSDDMLMRECAMDIVKGIQILQYLVQANTCLIGIEDNKPEAIEALKIAIKTLSCRDIRIIVIPTKYPSGGEKQLIKLLTNKEVPSGSIPATIGVVCQNIATTHAIYQAISHGQPLVTRITTISGEIIPHPKNIRARIGTPIKYLFQQAGIQNISSNKARIIVGGPMMGFTITDLNIPTTKTTNCLLMLKHNNQDAELPCIRCGLCAEVCPSFLLPQQLFWFSKASEFEKAEQHNLFDCIECGACSYVCPSQIPLVQYYRFAKGSIRQERIEHKKSNLSKGRYEDRLARIEKQLAEKEVKRQARAQAAILVQQEKHKKEALLEPVNNQNEIANTLKAKIRAQEERVHKSQKAVSAAQENQLDTLDALQKGLSKQEKKLSDFQSEFEKQMES